jgi:DNA repair ATPase RecN|tara:strand:- start:389 stop:775 length:387 start_codon:yes stop_codon:yes gene_type:complete
MNTQREVFNKLFKEDKTELATQKVDMSLASDGKTNMFKAVEKIYRNGEDLVDEFENNKKRANRQIQSVEKSYDKAVKIYKEVSTDLEKKASELDIAPNNIPDYDKLLKSLDFLRRKKDEIISNLKKYI